jgi:hypothetical protein
MCDLANCRSDLDSIFLKGTPPVIWMIARIVFVTCIFLLWKIPPGAMAGIFSDFVVDCG